MSQQAGVEIPLERVDRGSPAALVAHRPSTRANRLARMWSGDAPLSGRALAAVLALLVLVPPVAAGLVSTAQAPVYAAEADVLYVGSDASDSQGTERELATQQVLLQSRPLIQAAAKKSGRAAADLAGAVSVEILDQSNVLRLRVEDRDRRRAADSASSLVDEYIAAVAKQTAASGTAGEERALLEDEVDRLTARRTTVEERLASIRANPSGAAPDEQQTLENEAAAIPQRLAELEARLLDVNVRAVQEKAGRAQVLAAPSVLDEPVAPQPLRAAAGGALLGLLLATGLWTLLRHRRDRSRPAAL
jgi:hypothetical protein